MAKKKSKKGPLIQGFPDKFAKNLPETFKDAVETMDFDEMKKAMLKSETDIGDAEKDMEEDASLAKAKEDVKYLSGAYRDVMNREKAKVKYLVFVAKQRGYIG